MSIKKHSLPLLFFLCLSILLSACTVVYKNTGDILIAYVEDQGIPYMLATDDVVFSCAMVESFTPFLLSFSRVTTPPDKLAILFYLLSGSCTEFKAWEAELRYLRAIHNKHSIEAQDARIAQQRLLGLAARRQLTGYHYLVSTFGEPGAKCLEFDSDNDELYGLIGLLNGVQAIVNDIASGGYVGVSMGIAAKVGRGALCLDNEKWWGVPNAIHAAIGLSLPGNRSENGDPAEILKHAIQIGSQQGILVAQVLAAQVYLGLGNIEEVKHIIRSHARLITQAPENQAFKILNQISKLQIQAISDRLWTEATGKRTPLGKIGSFWDDSARVVETIDIDDML